MVAFPSLFSLVLGSSCGCLEASLVSTSPFWLCGISSVASAWAPALLCSLEMSVTAWASGICADLFWYLSLGDEAKNDSHNHQMLQFGFTQIFLPELYVLLYWIKFWQQSYLAYITSNFFVLGFQTNQESGHQPQLHLLVFFPLCLACAAAIYP